MELTSKIYVAGHNGLVGSAIIRELEKQGYSNIITRSHKDLDLTRQDLVEKFFEVEKPEYVFLAAAKVGGIQANSDAPADFMYDNMILEMNVINAAWKNGCKKLLFLGSSCIYPKFAPQPIKEDCLLTSSLEETNEAYALAKISGLKYCQYLNKQYGTKYISVMPTNLYGPNDNYHPKNSHVLPAMIRKFHEAKINNDQNVTCWGDGSALREFLYVDDLANLCVYLMNNYYGDETVNAGTGKEISIKDLAELVASIVGYKGQILWDTSKPNGTPRKLLDVSKAADLGWTYKTELSDGIKMTYQNYLNNMEIKSLNLLDSYKGESCLQGYINASVSQLNKIFGKTDHYTSEDYKTEHEWIIEIEYDNGDKTYFTIYDYKDFPKTDDEVFEFHIGAKNHADAVEAINALEDLYGIEGTSDNMCPPSQREFYEKIKKYVEESLKTKLP